MINKVEITEVAKQSMLDYAVSVIRGRAIPDVRDGLKPINRRILYAMKKDLGLDKGHMVKSAKVVGTVIGSYSPHGDAASYEAAVRMAQPFISSIPLIKGQGNFGSLNDPGAFAAQRYTEMKLSQFASDVFFQDLPYDCVEMLPTFDGTTTEPEALPARIPYFLLSSNIGIAVAFVTSAMPYNLKEVCDLTVEFINSQQGNKIVRPKFDIVKKFINGPDFPTGGVIIERSGIEQAMQSGKGSIKIRCKYKVKDDTIHLYEIPFTISKSRLIESISLAAKDTKGPGGEVVKARITEISSIKDLSSKDLTDIQIKCKKGTNPEVVVNKLFKFTLAQISLPNVYTAIVEGQPTECCVMDCMIQWYKFRYKTMRKKYTFLKNKCLARLHILDGILKVLADPEKAIMLIKRAKDKDSARSIIASTFELDDVQAEAVITLQVYRFSKAEDLKIRAEYKDVKEELKGYEKLLSDRDALNAQMAKEVKEISDKYSKQSIRKTEILNVYEADSLDEEDVIEKVQNVIYLSKRGYIKRVVEDEGQRVQNRGGKGRKFVGKDNDFVTDTVTCSSHDDLFFITSKGKVYCRKAFKIPEAAIDNIGVNVASILSLQDDENVTAMFYVPKGSKDYHIVTLTQNGFIKKTSFKDEYNSVGRESGIIACRLREDDKVVFAEAIPANNDSTMMVFTENGKAVTFKVGEIPLIGRTTFGVMAHKNKGVKVVSGVLLNKEELKEGLPLLILNTNGRGKRVKSTEFRICHRNTMGMIAITLGASEKVAFVCKAPDGKEVCVVSNTNIIRFPSDSVKIVLRPAKGFRAMKLDKGQRVVSASVV